MNWFTGIVLYVLIWWVALFAVLPVGTRPMSEADPASGWRGTPRNPHLMHKVIGTTLVAAIIWAGFYFIISSNWFSFRSGFLALPTN